LQEYAFKGIITMEADDTPKPVFWIGSSRKDLRAFPKGVRLTCGQALFDAQTGQEHPSAKALKGFGGRGVLEIVEDDSGSTYRAVYTLRFARVVYVLHAFQKKSKRGIRTPVKDIAIVATRLKQAEQAHEEWLKKNPVER
jgi:phage-related protein